jgi:hypothetical protein
LQYGYVGDSICFGDVCIKIEKEKNYHVTRWLARPSGGLRART